ncbi:hypothetical protein AWJ20_1285 [Sugiyamaella lignohabitans]|uniref:Cysteine dioxygenase n=1 Tax=Sugiyamaella lignohabitans TaxID=796027 RepID=A0A161HJR4_9ASCO|nr:uncharacterized protein AWJ20_1285 [Sugiyamaella lignohabitans]ANB13007.1 hypothetical protein AWJ20_1285 [Sugiyamaella lignohabitans]
MWSRADPAVQVHHYQKTGTTLHDNHPNPYMDLEDDHGLVHLTSDSTVTEILPPSPPEEQLTDSEGEHDSFTEKTITTSAFEQLVEDIRVILGPSSGIDSEDVDVEHLMARLREYRADHNEDEWTKYALADPSRNYTRNGVDDINKKANLLILVWNPGKGSLIHDHANAHCIVKVLKGTLTETLYDWPSHENEQLVPSKVTHIKPNDVTYMSDTLGLHRMSNPHPSEVAVSLHLYTPPYASKFGCHIFDEASGCRHKVDLSNLYSNKGILCKSNR